MLMLIVLRFQWWYSDGVSIDGGDGVFSNGGNGNGGDRVISDGGDGVFCNGGDGIWVSSDGGDGVFSGAIKHPNMPSNMQCTVLSSIQIWVVLPNMGWCYMVNPYKAWPQRSGVKGKCKVLLNTPVRLKAQRQSVGNWTNKGMTKKV